MDGDKPIRNFLDDPRRSGPVPDTDRKEGSRRHVRNWGGLDFDNVKTGNELEKEWTVSHVILGLHTYASRIVNLCNITHLSHFVNPPVFTESTAWSQGLRGHDHVHDRPGESGVPALEEGA